MRRVLFATAASLAALAVVLAVVVTDLPDPIAIHFGPDGTPDGDGPRMFAWVLGLGLPALVASVVTATTWSRRRPPAGLRWTAGLPLGMVWGVGGIMLATLWPQRGLADAATTALSPVAILVAVVLGVVATIAGARVAGQADPPTSVRPAPSGSVRADLPDGATALWRGETPTGPTVAGLGVALVVAGVVGGVLLAWWFTAILLAGALLVLASMRFAVTIGPGGVRIAGLVAGWPRVDVPLDGIAAADTTSIRPVEYGGWGIRMLPGRAITAVVTRSGPALRLVRTDDSTILVGLDDADEAAAVVNALLDRRAPTPATDPRTGSGSH